MGKSLREIAQYLKNDKKVQLIYAFNGTGKTRLSKEFEKLIPPNIKIDDAEQSYFTDKKVLYYNSFTEDLFYWGNGKDDTGPVLKIQENKFTRFILEEQGKDHSVITNFQHYTRNKLEPKFSENFDSVTFSFKRGNDEPPENIKISKGEESNFIWSIFFSFFDAVITILGTEPEKRETQEFNQLEYVFIDDPVSSLDENHLIELAVDLAKLIKSNTSELKFIITTHNPLFYNVLCNELKHNKRYILKKLEDGTYELTDQKNDSPFSYHLHLRDELKKAIDTNMLYKYHFNFLRNILEKTSTFLGYNNWVDLLPQTNDKHHNPYESRIINLSSHSKHSTEEVADLPDDQKRVLKYLFKDINKRFAEDKTDKSKDIKGEE